MIFFFFFLENRRGLENNIANHCTTDSPCQTDPVASLTATWKNTTPFDQGLTQGNGTYLVPVGTNSNIAMLLHLENPHYIIITEHYGAK